MKKSKDILDDYSNIDRLELFDYIDSEDEDDIISNEKSKITDISSVNLQVSNDNKVIISLNINDDIINILNNTKYKDKLKIQFEISKDIYMSLIDNFK
jgi:hypothetical protein